MVATRVNILSLSIHHVNSRDIQSLRGLAHVQLEIVNKDEICNKEAAVRLDCHFIRLAADVLFLNENATDRHVNTALVLNVPMHHLHAD